MIVEAFANDQFDGQPQSGRSRLLQFLDVAVCAVFEGSRQRSELPSHTRWIEKRSWGHVPMWCDPEGVADLILEGTR